MVHNSRSTTMSHFSGLLQPAARRVKLPRNDPHYYDGAAAAARLPAGAGWLAESCTDSIQVSESDRTRVQNVVSSQLSPLRSMRSSWCTARNNFHCQCRPARWQCLLVRRLTQTQFPRNCANAAPSRTCPPPSALASALSALAPPPLTFAHAPVGVDAQLEARLRLRPMHRPMFVSSVQFVGCTSPGVWKIVGVRASPCLCWCPPLSACAPTPVGVDARPCWYY